MTDIALWAAANVDAWRPWAIAALAVVYLAALAMVAAGWEEMR